MALHQLHIETPSGGPPDKPGWRPFLSYAFRPFYLLAAVQLVLFVALWVFGFNGTRAMPGFLWHAHEMVWGYAGAVIVGFLLTAVATWTGQPPLRGAALGGLAAVWLAARVAFLVVSGSAVPGAVLSVLFYLGAVLALAWPILVSRNTRNYVVIPMVALFGASNVVFHLALGGVMAADLRLMLHVGLIMVAGVIFFMGLRVIPFFTARRLAIEQVRHGAAVNIIGVASAFVLAIGVGAGWNVWLMAAVALVCGGLNLRRLIAWWHPGVLQVPLLWVLFIGYAFTALGIALYGLTLALQPMWMSAALHLVAVGGVAILTLGMMTRTALGHMGRPLEAPRFLPLAFILAALATVTRLVSGISMPADPVLVAISGVLLCLAFVIYLAAFTGWLLRPRADGKP